VDHPCFHDAVPAILARLTPETVFADLDDTFAGTNLSETGIARSDVAGAISAAARRPSLPKTLPLLDNPKHMS
jgi:hypothetical protein